jgi:hypothetical protein
MAVAPRTDVDVDVIIKPLAKAQRIRYEDVIAFGMVSLSFRREGEED